MAKKQEISTHNPYAAFLKAAEPNPETMTIQQFANYKSKNQIRLDQTFQRMKRSKKALLFLGAGCIIASLVGQLLARYAVLGSDGQGGPYFNMRCNYDTRTYAFHRQIQRAQFMAEGNAEDPSLHSKQLIKDLNIEVPNNGLNNVRRKSANEKYFY